MKYLRNPLTGEVKIVTPLAGKKLASYGWQRVTRADFDRYQHAKIEAAIIKHIPKTRPRLGHLH